MIDLTDYRRDFARFTSELELIRFEKTPPNTTSQKNDRLADRFGHLFERATVLELKELVRAEGSFSETESTGRRLLCGAAVSHYVEQGTRDYRREWDACAAATRVAWRNELLDESSAPNAIAGEADRDPRMELGRRWQGAFARCAEPKLELLGARQNALRDLGYAGTGELWSETRRLDLAQLERAAAGFLQQTENVYFHGLAELRGRNPEIRNVDQLDISDQFRWARLARFDRLFPAAGMVDALKISLNWMEIDVTRQANLRIDVAPETSEASRTRLFRIRPPEDVRLVVAEGNGASDYRDMFDAAGRAEQAAWISPSFWERTPEFIYSPDRATVLAFGRLFAHLHLDQAWVSELYLAGTAGGAAAVVAEFALLALHDLRERCAELAFWSARDAAGDIASEGAAVDYAARLRDATGFGRDGITFLARSLDGFSVADELRAMMFESMFLEHLRSNYGNRWWAERAAAGELRDIWNTGSRYSVEELGRMLGLGDVGFDAVADRIIRLIP